MLEYRCNLSALFCNFYIDECKLEFFSYSSCMVVYLLLNVINLMIDMVLLYGSGFCVLPLGFGRVLTRALSSGLSLSSCHRVLCTVFP